MNYQRIFTVNSKTVTSSTAFSTATDANTDISDAAQLVVFIHGVDKNKRNLWNYCQGRNDTFQSLVETLDQLCVHWAKTECLATDEAPQMSGRKAGLATKLKEQVQL